MFERRIPTGSVSFKKPKVLLSLKAFPDLDTLEVGDMVQLDADLFVTEENFVKDPYNNVVKEVTMKVKKVQIARN